MAGGSVADRATINKQQFVACPLPMAGGGDAADSKVGSSAQVLNILSWDPALNDVDVDHGHSVKINLEAINTGFKDLHYDEGTDFSDTGEFVQTKVVDDGVELGTSSPDIDFEDYNVDTNLVDVSQPHEWLNRSPFNGMTIRDDIAGEPDNQYVKCQYYNQNSMCSLEDVGVLNSGVIRARFRFETTGPVLFFFLTTGAGSALRGHGIQVSQGSVWTGLFRLNHSDYWYGLGSHNLGFTPASDIWYWIDIKFENRGTDIVAWWKVWEEGDAEPGAYQHGKTDGSYIQDGVVGLAMKNGVDNTIKYIDNFSIVPIPASHYADGTWEDSQDVSAVEHYSNAIATFDKDTPANTTAVVKARWRDIDSWTTLTSGQEIPGIDLGDDMTEGASKDTLSFRFELATTEAAATPAVSNLRVYFDPVASDALELDVAGRLSVVADRTLDVWGKKQMSGGEQIVAWDDVWLQTDGPPWAVSPGAWVTAALNYGGVLIDSIGFNAARDLWMESFDLAGWYWGMTPLVYESPPVSVRWNVRTPWFPGGHIYEWILVDKGIGIHADAYYIVGIPVRNDHPLSMLVAVPNLHNHPLSIQPKGWARDDHPLSMLIQGWARHDHPLSYLPGVYTINDQPVSFLAAIEYLNDHPMSLLVYGVSREGMIEVNIIDTATWTALTGLGYTRS